MDQSELDELYSLAQLPEIAERYRPVRDALTTVLGSQDPEPEVRAGLEGLCLACVLATFSIRNEGGSRVDVARLTMHLIANVPYLYSDWLQDVERALRTSAMPQDVRNEALAAYRGFRAYLLHLSWLEDRPGYLDS